MEIKELFGKLKNHKIVKVMLQEEEAETAKLRKELLSAGAEENDNYLTTLKQHNDNVIDSEKAVLDAREKLKTAEQSYGRAIRERQLLNVQHDQFQIKVKVGLSRSAPTEIDTFIHTMLKKLDEVQATLRTMEREGKPNVFTDRRPRFVYTNIKAINAAANYIRLVIDKAEEMKYIDLEGIDVAGTLAELLSNVPNTDEWQEIKFPEIDLSELKYGKQDEMRDN